MEIESAAKSGEKRPAEDGGGGGGGAEVKKVKREGLVEDMRKVAEMVLVLAAMGKMRGGGKVPTEAEKEIMSDARYKLAEVCQFFAPKDVFPRDVFGCIIEDLGLNKVKEQRLGFRPPKISIAEKLMFSKRKMEKSDDLSQPSTINTSRRLYANSGAAVDGRGPGPSPAARGFPSVKPGHRPISSGSFQPATPIMVHAASTNSSALPYQLPTSEVRPVVSGGLPSNHLVKDSISVALPKTDRPQFRLDGRTNGSSHTLQFQANSSGAHIVGKTPPWSAQPQAVPSARIASETRVPTQSVFKVKGDARPGMAPHVSSSKPFITQSASANPQSVHQHFQGMNTVQAPPVRNTHFDIGKIVQKFLQPCNSDRPPWTPPSRDYMNKAFTCQVCKFTANDVDSVLVCDACEKGFHLKCLQINNPKGVPRAEWHCPKCLQLSNGKPLPPKYGRVMRNMNSSKAPTNITSIQTSSEKKAGSLDGKVNQQKIKANGSISLHSSATANVVNNYSHQTFVSKIANASEMRGNAIAVRGKVDEKPSSGTLNEITETSVPALSLSGTSVKRDYEQKPLDSKPYPPGNPEAFQSVSVHSQSLANLEGNQQLGLSNEAVPSKQSLDNDMDGSNLKEPSGEEDLCNKTQESSGDDRETVRGNPADASTTSAGHTELQRSLPHYVHSVDWIGGTVRVDDDKIFFHSCRVNGVMYKLQEYVLVRFNNDRLVPSKLQAMWEDRTKKTKWVTLNRFYFPGDLPEAVGRPCGLETCEVYESIYSCSVMAGSIEGPCDVLPPSMFAVEKEKRASLGTGPNANSRPLFLRKWIYDESKGLFRDASC